MKRKAIFFIFMSVLAGLNVGTVRKTEDPIRDTETNPILYEQKKEEEKDGKKGALMYHVKNVPHETFFIDPPFEKTAQVPAPAAAPEKAPSSTGTSGWWEEQPQEPANAGGMVSETVPESSPEAEKPRDQKSEEPSAAVTEAEDAKSDKRDGYWW